MIFYDINGNRIFIAECRTCHTQISLTSDEYNNYPSLIEIDEQNKCCEKPYYRWYADILEIQKLRSELENGIL